MKVKFKPNRKMPKNIKTTVAFMMAVSAFMIIGALVPSSAIMPPIAGILTGFGTFAIV